MVPYASVDVMGSSKEVSSRAEQHFMGGSSSSYYYFLKLLWILIRNAMSPTFLMAQIILLGGNTLILVIESKMIQQCRT